MIHVLCTAHSCVAQLAEHPTVNRTVTGSSPVAGAKAETLMGVGFPVETGRAAKGAEGGYSLQFSDKLVEPSRKKPKKAPRHADKAFSGRSVGCSAAFAVRPLAYHMGEGERGGNRRERGPRTGVSRVSEAYRPPTVRCRPHRMHGRARDHQGRPILSRKCGRERKGGYGQERPQWT